MVNEIMSLAKAVTLDIPGAVKLVKNLVDNPMIISTSPGWAVSIEAESVIQSGEADVSVRPVVVPGTEARRFLYDNVSPQPWSWEISGYIPGDPDIEKTTKFTPIVLMNTGFIKKAFQNGSRIIFKDADNWIYPNCVISSLRLEQKSTVANKKPVALTIREIVEIKAELSTLTETEAASTASGASSDLGTTATSNVTKTDSTFYSSMKKIGLIK